MYLWYLQSYNQIWFFFPSSNSTWQLETLLTTKMSLPCPWVFVRTATQVKTKVCHVAVPLHYSVPPQPTMTADPCGMPQENSFVLSASISHSLELCFHVGTPAYVPVASANWTDVPCAAAPSEATSAYEERNTCPPNPGLQLLSLLPYSVGFRIGMIDLQISSDFNDELEWRKCVSCMIRVWMKFF